MTLVGGAIAAILTGHSIVGFVALIVGAGTLAGAFIAPRIFSQKQMEPPPPGSSIEQAQQPGGEDRPDAG
jgi:uncharacterized protein YneF (UPF0154 family)